MNNFSKITIDLSKQEHDFVVWRPPKASAMLIARAVQHELASISS